MSLCRSLLRAFALKKKAVPCGTAFTSFSLPKLLIELERIQEGIVALGVERGGETSER